MGKLKFQPDRRYCFTRVLAGIMHGLRPLFVRGRWEVHCILSGICTSVNNSGAIFNDHIPARLSCFYPRNLVANRRTWPGRHGDCADPVLVPAMARTDHRLSDIFPKGAVSNEPTRISSRLRIQFLALLMLMGMGALGLRLWWIQVAHGAEWTAQLRGSSQATVRIPSVRGEIKDRNGLTLVQNRASYEVDFYLPEMVKGYRERFGSPP